MLRLARGSCPELQAPGVHLLNRGDFTVVIWRVARASPSHLRATLRMSMAKLSTWSLRRCRLSQTLVTPGKPGAAAGTPMTRSTLSSLARQIERDVEEWKDKIKP